MNYWILFGGIMLISWIVSSNMKRRFKEYSNVPSPNGMSGYDVAVKMLRDNGINDVQVVSTPGFLSDHYNPQTKTVNLSQDVYSGRNISALAVAAHECGHAVQHATAYSWLTMRSKLVPAVEFSSRWVQWVILGGLLLLNTFPQLLLFGIALFAIMTLFSFVTLPVEIDASRRAITWLSNAGITNIETTPKAEKALRSAAMTYVVAALSSLASLVYYLMIYLGGSDD